MMVERERLDADVLIVGAGPAGLACALHLARLIEAHNKSVATGASGGGAGAGASGTGSGAGGAGSRAQPFDSAQGKQAAPLLSTENIYVLEKGRELGAHQLSGAVMDPRGLAELIPDFATAAPAGAIDSPVTDDAVHFFTEKSSYKLPITPPPLRNHGNYVVSLSKLTKWLGGLVEQKGVNVFTQFAGASLIYEREGPEGIGAGIAGVITEDKGVDKDGKPKSNFTPGYELRAKVTVLAEGPRGSLTKQLVSKYKLDGLNPQVYSIGIKELWEVPPGRVQPGFVAHTMGWPVPFDMYGGGWIYGMTGNRVSLGLVIGLEYHDPQFDPHEAFQRYKTHPFVRRILEGGKLVRYGAKTIPAGGWYSMPRNYVDGGLIIGDSGSFLNAQRLKGIGMGIKSGMLAAETIFEALKAGDTSAAKLAAFKQKVDASWIKKELWETRNFHQAFEGGFWSGMFHAGVQFLTGGRGLKDPWRVGPGHERYHQLDGKPLEVDRFKGDGKLTFDRLTDVYHSGTRHEEDQPCHLRVADTNICADRCTREYGNPCQYFCPAAVYEMAEEKGQRRLKINFSNCVHCKTCDIMDPYQIIDWVVPEGGGGPNYEGM